jgi:hypothetical protein
MRYKRWRLGVPYPEDPDASSPLTPREDGETPWRRHVWAREMRAAVAKHSEDAKGFVTGRSHVSGKPV